MSWGRGLHCNQVARSQPESECMRENERESERREKFTAAEYRISCFWLNFIHQGVY